ncbi:MAG: hypothetical protein WAO40_06205 [Candidatus Nanopelagicales bacterium]|nr:hypothetical protein [Candidatus Nanopelagicales bacterium]MDP4888321.1 hypothetical protein [Candidatus Nanopelagicales bacterium]
MTTSPVDEEHKSIVTLPQRDCFAAAIEASRIAVTYRTPVFLPSDGYLANGSQLW